MKSIFVTGGTGFIGSHTCLLLLEKGYVVFILDSFINSCKKSITNISIILKEKCICTKEKIYLIKGDLKNLRDIEKVFQLSSKLGKKIEAVIHFAGLKSVYDSSFGNNLPIYSYVNVFFHSSIALSNSFLFFSHSGLGLSHVLQRSSWRFF